MDVASVIRHRLRELGLEQRDLAAAAQVTESYISQLLAGKKAPPAPGRTGIYDKIGRFLRLPGGELSRLAALQRREDARKRVADPPPPLFKSFRELIVRKCVAARQPQILNIFEKEPFGALERLVTRKLLDIAKRVVREEFESENWLKLVARLTERSYRQMRALVLDFLDTDLLDVSVEKCVTFLDPLIESWDIDLETFAMEIVLNRSLTVGSMRRLEFVEREPEWPFDVEPGLEEFLREASLSRDITDDEIEFLRRLRFKDKRPQPLYYYRMLQDLRDPIHFQAAAAGPGREGFASGRLNAQGAQEPVGFSNSCDIIEVRGKPA